MQNLSEIKTHLRAAEQTRKMTNALSLLSTARMKKSMQKAQYYDEYYTRVRSAVKGLLEKAPNMSHPFLEKRPIQRAAFVMISGEKACVAVIIKIYCIMRNRLSVPTAVISIWLQ